MADNSDIAALYPPPPQYYKFFTAENVAKYNELKQDQEVSDDDISQIHDIKFLLPPKQPDKEQYRSFGELWWFQDKHVGLKESGIEQIYGETSNINKSKTENDELVPDVGDVEEIDEEEVFTKTRIEELKKMTKSVLLNFLELLGLLSKNPTLAPAKIENIRTILINIHHLLNSYRLHQSRETLIFRMQEKLAETNEEIISISQTCSNVQLKLNQLVDRIECIQQFRAAEVREKSLEPTEMQRKIKLIPKDLWQEATQSLSNDK